MQALGVLICRSGNWRERCLCGEESVSCPALRALWISVKFSVRILVCFSPQWHRGEELCGGIWEGIREQSNLRYWSHEFDSGLAVRLGVVMFRAGIGKLQVVYVYVCVSEREIFAMCLWWRECAVPCLEGFEDSGAIQCILVYFSPQLQQGEEFFWWCMRVNWRAEQFELLVAKIRFRFSSTTLKMCWMGIRNLQEKFMCVCACFIW